MKKKILYTIPLIASFLLSSCYTQFAVPREKANDYVVREERYRMARDQERRQETVADSSQAYGYDYDDLYGQEESYDDYGDVYITEYDINVLPAVRAYRYSVYTPWYTSSIYRPWHRYGHFRHGFYFDYYSDYYAYAPYDFWYDDYWYGPYGYPTVVVGVFPGYYDPWYPGGYYDPYYYGGGYVYTPSKPRKARSFTTDGSTLRKDRRRHVTSNRNTTGTMVASTPRTGRRPASVRPVTAKRGGDTDVRQRRNPRVKKSPERFREKRLTGRRPGLTAERRGTERREKKIIRNNTRRNYERSYYDMSKRTRTTKKSPALRKSGERRRGTVVTDRRTKVKTQKTRTSTQVKSKSKPVKRSAKKSYTRSTRSKKSSSYTPRSSGHSSGRSGYRSSGGHSRSSYSPRSSSGRSGSSRSSGSRSSSSSGRRHR